jgi:hypothetical protein
VNGCRHLLLEASVARTIDVGDETGRVHAAEREGRVEAEQIGGGVAGLVLNEGESVRGEEEAEKKQKKEKRSYERWTSNASVVVGVTVCTGGADEGGAVEHLSAVAARADGN